MPTIARNSLLGVFSLFALSSQAMAGEWIENLKIRSLQFSVTTEGMTVYLERSMIACGTGVASFDIPDSKHAKPGLLTAFAANKKLKVYVDSCSNAIPTVTVFEIQ